MIEPILRQFDRQIDFHVNHLDDFFDGADVFSYRTRGLTNIARLYIMSEIMSASKEIAS